MMPGERRKQLRVAPAKNHPVRIDINGEDFLDILYARDIGQGGVSILVPHLFEGCMVNSDVILVVSLPAPVNKSFSAQGRIRHIAGKMFGVRFIHLERRDAEDLRRYIASRIKHESWLTQLRFKLGLIG